MNPDNRSFDPDDFEFESYSEQLGGLFNQVGFRQVISASSGEEMAHRYFLGAELLSEGDPTSAQEIFSHLTSLNPFEKRYWTALAACHILLNEEPSAIEALQAAKTLEPQDAQLYLHTALCQIRLGNLVDGIFSLVCTVQRAGNSSHYLSVRQRAEEWLQKLGVNP